MRAPGRHQDKEEEYMKKHVKKVISVVLSLFLKKFGSSILSQHKYITYILHVVRSVIPEITL